MARLTPRRGASLAAALLAILGLSACASIQSIGIERRPAQPMPPLTVVVDSRSVSSRVFEIALGGVVVPGVTYRPDGTVSVDRTPTPTQRFATDRAGFAAEFVREQANQLFRAGQVRGGANRPRILISLDNLESSKNDALLVLSVMTLFLPNLLGSPLISHTADVTLTGVISTFDGQELARIRGTGRATAYAALYWGYSWGAAWHDGSDVSMAAQLKALAAALVDLRGNLTPELLLGR